MNTCSKPGCTRTGAAVLGYDYAARRALMTDPPEGAVSPHLYVLCGPCAERLRPPQGWVLDDSRTTPPLFIASDPRPEVEEVVLDDGEEQDGTLRRQLFFGYSA